MAEPQVLVTGETFTNMIISLNDEITLSDAEGKFSALVPLVEGINVIEIVASDLEGNEVSLELTVVYEPGG